MGYIWVIGRLYMIDMYKCIKWITILSTQNAKIAHKYPAESTVHLYRQVYLYYSCAKMYFLTLYSVQCTYGSR